MEENHASNSATALRVRTRSTRGYIITKRTLDVVGASAGLILGGPILAIAAVAVRLDTNGPVMFRQTRVGQFGRPFMLYKLRGMYCDARERFPELYDYSVGPDNVGDWRFHTQHDPRVTRVGRVLRRLSLDELPNLWNVLKGEMSLVGPRPEIPEMLPYYGEAAAPILSVKPGVTSLSKVRGRDELTLAETLACDVEYVGKRSLWLDLRILARTAMTLFRGGWVVG